MMTIGKIVGGSDGLFDVELHEDGKHMPLTQKVKAEILNLNPDFFEDSVELLRGKFFFVLQVGGVYHLNVPLEP